MKFSHQAMDTEFTVLFADDGDAALKASAAAECFARIDALETMLSRFNDTSDPAAISSLRDGGSTAVNRETMEVLKICVDVAAATGGAFDPTVEAHNFGELVLDVEHLLVGVKNGPVRLDFGGVGKGYALDECASILKSELYELDGWLLDAGSSTQLASGGDWPLGVGGRWKQRTRLPTVIHLSSGAVSGSGFEIQGAHVRDPRHGGMARRWTQSWSKAQSAAVADALSTAVLSMTSSEITAACRDLTAEVIVAREQPTLLDRVRDPLKLFSPA